jgi:two-component system LytT family response regulator
LQTVKLIRCIVVDDDHPATRLLSGYVKRTPGLQLVLQTTSSPDALDAINKGLADLVFLDIQMPDMTGIELIQSIKAVQTKVIFTTAYTAYALDGFEYDVIDYLLKPITYERFLTAIGKARQRLVTAMPQPCSGHLMLKTEYKVQRTDFSSILYIEGLGDYLMFYLSTGKLMTLERMKNMEQELPPACFIRIHKSYIINITRIEYFEKGKIVINGKSLPVGDTFKAAVRSRLGW